MLWPIPYQEWHLLTWPSSVFLKIGIVKAQNSPTTNLKGYQLFGFSQFFHHTLFDYWASFYCKNKYLDALDAETTLFVWKSYTHACCNHIRACRNHTRECHKLTHTCQNNTLRVEITLVRVEITVVSVEITILRVKVTIRVKITLCVYKSHSWVSLLHSWVSDLHAYLSKLLLCEWKPYSACKITLIRVKIPLLVQINLARVEIALVRDQILACRKHTPCKN
jgi:hypothetical protein